MATLLEECIEILGVDVEILNKEKEEKLIEAFEKNVKFGVHGIDWTNYPNYIEIKDANELLNYLKEQKCYILWDEFSTPTIKSKLSTVINNIDDVTAVAFDTYLFDWEFSWVVEFHHEGKIRIIIFDKVHTS